MSKIPDEQHEYIPGDHKLVCERTGRVIRRSDARQEWTGIWVHKDWWEPKHPSLINRKIPTDKIAASQPVRPDDGSAAAAVSDSVYEIGVYEFGVYE